jgi:uncharacterized membrane protein
MSTIAEILSIVLALVFLLSGAVKFSGTEMAAGAPGHLQIAPSTYRLAGILELLGALGLFLAAIGVIGTTLGWLAAFCLAAMMAMAVKFHVSVGDGAVPENQTDGWAPAAVLGCLSLLTGLLILL